MSRTMPRFLCFVAYLAALAGSPAYACEALPSLRSFSVESQPLPDALNVWAKQAGFDLIWPAHEAAATRMAPRVQGELRVEEALRQLLEGSGLTYRFVDANTVAIGPPQVSATGEESWRVAQTVGDGQARQGEEATPKLEEIVVTAQKRKEVLKDVPISISVLSGDSMDKSTFTGVMEALRTVPGVEALPNIGVAGGTSLAIRGASSSSVFTGSSTVGYYLDGVPFSLIRDAIVPDQNAFDLERVEVARGPQGTLYGASAQSGLIRVLTNNADLNHFEFKSRSTLSQTDGAVGVNYRGDVAVNVPLVEGKLAARAVVGYESNSGWIDTPAGNDSNSNRTRTYRIKVNAQPTEQLSIALSSWINRGNQDAGPFSNDDARRGFQNPPFSDLSVTTLLPEPLVEHYEVDNLQIAYEFPAFTLTSSTGYLDYRGIGNIDYSRYFGPGVFHSEIPAHSISEEVLFNSASGSAWKWTAGALYRDLRSQLYQVGSFLPIPAHTFDTSKSTALFGQVGHRFGGDRFEWTLGARYFKDENSEREADDSLSATDGIRYFVKERYSATTPRAVLTWYPSKTATIYASYAQGFRSGLPQNFAVGLANPGLPGAKPDKLNNYEVGAKFDLFDRRMSFDVAAYYMRWNDVIGSFAVPYRGTFVTGLGNGKSASGPGVDFSMVVRPVDGLELGLSAGWNDLTQDADVNLTPDTQAFAAGDRLDASPKLSSTAFIHFQRPLGTSGYRGVLSLSTSYASAMETHWAGLLPQGRAVFRGDDLVFGQASFAVESPHGWSASLFVDNFTNENGEVLPSTIYYADDYITHFRPRAVGVQFEYRWGGR